MTVTPMSAEAIEDGRRLFTRAWTFSRGSPDLDHLPPDDRPEIAFAGRSNVGQLRLVRASNTPGRTQELNFFTEPEDSVYLVDMPGYGFAQAPKDKVVAWNSTLRGYLSGRQTLLRVILLVDARHGLKPADEEMMTLLDTAAVSYQAILTKADKISQTDLAKTTTRTTQALAKHPAAYPSVIATSAETGMGFEELRAAIAKLLDAHGK